MRAPLRAGRAVSITLNLLLLQPALPRAQYSLQQPDDRRVQLLRDGCHASLPGDYPVNRK